jgi:hypothetical protein
MAHLTHNGIFIGNTQEDGTFYTGIRGNRMGGVTGGADNFPILRKWKQFRNYDFVRREHIGFVSVQYPDLPPGVIS